MPVLGAAISGLVIAAATAGAIGDNIGYVLGRELGFRFLVRFGSYLRLSDARIKLGQDLFLALFVLAAVAVLWGFIYLKRHETELETEAETALPGPLRSRRRHRTTVSAALGKSGFPATE